MGTKKKLRPIEKFPFFDCSSGVKKSTVWCYGTKSLIKMLKMSLRDYLLVKLKKGVL